ncbi:MAG: hypothetical protein Q8Q09_17570 [Deltaproteobacteria bacterium]|nr:hypothetical protein [Deltaproteobacteria bacterium]
MKSQYLLSIGVTLALSVLAPRDAVAGPWVQAPGHAYIKMWARYLPGFSYFDGNGTRFDYASYHELFFSTYAEVGLARGVGVSLHLPIAQIFALSDPSINRTQIHATVGDPTVAMRFELLRYRRALLSVEAGLRLPVATGEVVQPVISAREPYVPVGGLRIGNGTADVSMTLHGGVLFRHWYTAGSIGAVYRNNGYDPAATINLEAGTQLLKGRLGLRARVGAYLSLPWGTAPRHDSPSGMGNGTRYWGFAVEADYRVARNWALGLSFEGGAGPIRRQTGGPVINLYAAAQF